MYRYGHYGAALVCIALVVVILIVAGFAELGLLAGVAAIDLAVVPDFDQRVPFVTHRGLTDTIWFALLVGVIMAGVAVAIAIASVVVSALVGFVVGTVTVVSHIAADGLTPAGVRPRAPLDDRHSGEPTGKLRAAGNWDCLRGRRGVASINSLKVFNQHSSRFVASVG